MGIDVADADLIRWGQAVGRTVSSGSCTLQGWTYPLKFEPGDGWYYGSGLDWAGVVAGRATGGKRFGEVVAEGLLGPLRMADTGFYRNKLLEGGKDARYVPPAERSAETGELAQATEPYPEEPPLESGGAGLYSSAEDYGRVMQGVLRALAGEEGGVVSQETAREMFRPQLDEKQREWCQGIVFTYGSAAELPQGTPVDYGIGGLINMVDVEGKRRKGSLMWPGMCNSRWWIDPETGIGAVLIVNVIPYGDATVLKLYDELERAVYAELVPQWKQSSK
ncbi:hypothetical protein VTI74DRAFT_2755 [Chaetomium olivicolor]